MARGRRAALPGLDIPSYSPVVTQGVKLFPEYLKEDGLYENSIIFFYGDHGGPFPRYKRALYDTGV